ncbi:MAG TPA: dethiobiotin synthase [Mycobacteriales bacterium]|nr:dethiobiotin synthase [Mycobacteriales bacterium]
MTALVVTGTGTEVGKTIVTAAVAALAVADGQKVTVVKPAQTGVLPGEEADVDVLQRLSGGADAHELVRYDDPLAPATAAKRQNRPAVPVDALIEEMAQWRHRDLLLVEGAGGLMVELDAEGHTLADVARGLEAEVLVVTPAGLGALNATALTCEALRHRGLGCRGVVIGSWPDHPGLAEQCNLLDLPRYAQAPLLGAMPARAGRLTPAEFFDAARGGLAAELGGTWHAEVL